ncbi:MAG: recombinase family protein, partial [Microcoleaceae cyanobacterium]
GTTNSPMLTEPTQPIIDPVRAGLLADYCFVPDLENPHLLDSKTFQRWDRLGHQASQAYEQIRQWIEQQRSQQAQGQIPNPVFLLDRAIERFYLRSDRLVHSQLSALRELMETAIHYEEIENRLTYYQDNFPYIPPINIMGQMSPWSREKIGQFIQILQRGIISANPYPVKVMGKSQSAVTLATIFQYRNQRSCHPWQFWLDVGSPLWLSSGSANLFAFPLFLRSHLGNTYNREDITMADQDRLSRILLDLLSRLEQPETAIMGPQFSKNRKNSANIQRIWLCHSELAVNGQEQTGPLLPLITSLTS